MILNDNFKVATEKFYHIVNMNGTDVDIRSGDRVKLILKDNDCVTGVVTAEDVRNGLCISLDVTNSLVGIKWSEIKEIEWLEHCSNYTCCAM